MGLGNGWELCPSTATLSGQSWASPFPCQGSVISAVHWVSHKGQWMRRGPHQAVRSLLSPWPRTECTTRRACAIRSGHPGLPLQPVWKTGTRRELGDPTRPQVSAHSGPHYTRIHPAVTGSHRPPWINARSQHSLPRLSLTSETRAQLRTFLVGMSGQAGASSPISSSLRKAM